MSEKKYDIVYLYKESHTPSLRYSLRSLVNVPVREVFIVGDKPQWVENVVHIPFEFVPSKIMSVWGQILRACDVVDDFLLFNDDFFILQPLDGYTYHRGDITRRPSTYFNAYTRTKELFKGFRNFEVHAPMLINSERFKGLTSCYDINQQYLHRSLYGNHYNIESQEVEDNKIRSLVNVREGLKKPFMSTTNNVERNPSFLRQINKLFPNKSIYEANDIH